MAQSIDDMISGSQYKATPAPAQTQSANKPQSQSAPSGLNIDDMISKSPHNAGNQSQQSTQPQTPSQPDAFQQAVNYHTGNDWIDAPMGVLQGAAKGVAGIGETIGAGTRYLMGKPQASQQEQDLDTKASGIGQGTGKFLEQTAEYALPAGEVAKGLKGAGLGIKALGQAGVGAGVSALQSKGDIGATAAGAALGAAGELVGPALKGIASLVGTKVPNLSNFSQ